jgi:hypothetical protein
MSLLVAGTFLISALYAGKSSWLGNAPEQQSDTGRQHDGSKHEEQSDEIVVEGYLKRDLQTKSKPVAAVASSTRQAYSVSEMLAKCAVRGRLSTLVQLRSVVDGVFNSALQYHAQDRLVRSNITCGENAALLSFSSRPKRPGPSLDNALKGDFSGLTPSVADSAPLGHSILDRGAFTIQAIKRYAPDLTLTPAQTADPVVRARFDSREIPRNRFREPADYRYFEVAVCMVRVEPRLAVMLAKTEGAARANDLQAALIDRARICVGNARRVRVDATEFRLYIADAVYRWAVAAKGVETLIQNRAN